MKSCNMCNNLFEPKLREGKCKPCSKLHRRKLFDQNPEHYRELKKVRLRNWRNKNREYIRQQAALVREAKPEQHRQHSINYNRKNKEKIKIKNKKYKTKHPHLAAEHANIRRIKKLRGCLSNIDSKGTREIYKECSRLNKESSINHHVDHIIPLTHPDVCGLHVSWNMQIIPSLDNHIKKNKFDGTYENESWRVNA